MKIPSRKEEFFKGIHKKIVELEYEDICLIGDYNAIVDVKKDYKSGKKIRKKILPKEFFNMAAEINLRDVWRETHEDENQFTFYSHPHQYWSRIDMAWMTVNIRTGVEKIEIGVNQWADHNPILINWRCVFMMKGNKHISDLISAPHWVPADKGGFAHRRMGTSGRKMEDW